MNRKPQINNDKINDFIFGAKDEKNKAPEQVQNQEQRSPKEEIDLHKLRRQTYYITELYIQAIEQMAFYERMDKSEIVREALKQYIPSKYLNLAIKR